MVWNRAPISFLEIPSSQRQRCELEMRAPGAVGRPRAARREYRPTTNFYIRDKMACFPTYRPLRGNNVQRHPLNSKYVGKAHRGSKIVIARHASAIKAGKFNHPTVTGLGGYNA